jgi:RHS repeat-associated protein
VYHFAYTVANGKSTQTDVTDPRGFIRRVTFNPDGYSLSETSAYGQPEARTTTTDRVSSSNFVATATDSLNAQVVYVRDDLGNVTAVTRCLVNQSPCTDTSSGALTTRYTYEPHFQQVATITDPLEHTTSYGYDAAGNLTSTTDPLQHQTTFAYNSIGQLTSTTDALQHTTTFGYSGGDLTTVTDPLSRVTTRFVDAGGRLVAITDSARQTTRYMYDSNNHVQMVTDVLGGQTSLAYLPEGQLQSVTDPNQHTTSYTYDAMGRIASRLDPLQRAETFTYDLNGNPSQWTDRKGQIATRTYDAIGRLHQIMYDDASTTTYSYDARDRVTQIDDTVSGSIVRTYDDFDRVTSESTSQGSVSYTYDGAGRRQTMTVAGQPVVTYTYDDANRLTGITRDALSVGMTYDDSNRRSTLTLPDGIVTTYGYDDASQLTSLSYQMGSVTLGNLTYTYDNAGRRVQIGGSSARTGLPQSLASATYDAANQLTTWDDHVLSYDANGNLASDGGTAYTRDSRNQLVGMSGAREAGFSYDALGRRSGSVLNGSSTGFLYDGANIVQELVGSAPTANLLTGFAIDTTLARTDVEGTATLLVDAVGSTVALADGSGTLQTEYTYEPFGMTTTSGGASGNSLQFTGRENDGTGLYYYRTRYYYPQIGRFASEDGAGLAAGINVYVYANNSPNNYNDTTGLAPGDNGLGGDIQALRNIFPDSAWDPSANALVIHMPCPQVIHVLFGQGYQNANSWGYNGPGSAFWNPIGHAGGMEWRTYGPGFHFRMVYPSTTCDRDCTLDEFHVDKYNPIEPGQFWRHIQCDFLHLCSQ